MAQSMTGYGRREGRAGDVVVVAEMRSTNHKFCDVVVRLPKILLPLEGDLRKKVQERFSRGRVELAISLNGTPDKSKKLELDLDLAGQYYRMAGQLKRKFKLKADVDLASLLSFRDVVSVAEIEEEAGRLSKKVDAVVDGAMKRLAEMRRKEGQTLVRDLLLRVKGIEKRLKTVHSNLPKILKGYQARLNDRIKKLSGGLKPDPARVAQEVAFFAERTDIHEELTRLASHLDQFRKMIRSNKPVGRSLDFLIQEMNREVNTIGSKANDAGVAMEVVGIKSEMEKMREQIQNIE
ncbi:MAG TPA: YicC/YloC family endoribonuclease [Nitrospiria bacterium]|nr:YicC/YloC family endoribonuclease [Nitrospiria bacterium]